SLSPPHHSKRSSSLANLLPLALFISGDDANKVIKRHRRANSLLLEEVLQGSLERECLEERCTHEEAREVFENDDMLKMFWDAYYEGKRCSSNPCQHNGVCEDNIRSYTCTCVDGYEGENYGIIISDCVLILSLNTVKNIFIG
uniref:Protein Z, vitamin K dependent plasma glycoprotein n=1 Tax=Nothoprocta perdicaria TaxID=30464 RepID=A0A8C7A2F4_NOTPE